MRLATIYSRSSVASVLGLGISLAQMVPAEEAPAGPPATQTNDVQQLPGVVVTATRTEEEAFSLPYSVSVVSTADFERRLPRTTPEALRELPSVMLQKTSHGQGSPYLRGFTGFRTLMLIDGIRLNNSTFREGPNQYWNTVDSFALERLEVVRGPSSVLYGSDAIGGTVNAVPLSRTTYGEGFDWDARTLYRFSSAEASHIGRAEISGNFDEKLGFLLGSTIKDFGDLRGGHDVRRQRKTGYAEQDWDANVQYKFTPNSRLVFGHQTVDQDDAWRTHSTVYAVPWAGSEAGDDQRRILDQFRDLTYLQYHLDGMEGFVEEVHTAVSYHYQAEDERRLRDDFRRELQDIDVHTVGISVQLQSSSPVGRWVYGPEYYRDWVDSTYRRYAADGSLQVERRQGPVADDAIYDLFGFYVEDHVPLLNERLELILGGRYTHAGTDARDVEDPATGESISIIESWNTVVGSGRVLVHIDEANHWNAIAGISQGFRAPNISDLTRFDIARSGEQEIPSFDLDPEQFVT
jgi:hemoglobin/transferrin/lactoferrin receptor protein